METLELINYIIKKINKKISFYSIFLLQCFMILTFLEYFEYANIVNVRAFKL